MKRNWRKVAKAAMVVVLATGLTNAIAADHGDLGKLEYESSCILCHGKDLKGGPTVKFFLKAMPPDLTQLSSKNAGVFPYDRVYGVIDGRQDVASHGTREMPIWGKAYQFKGTECNIDALGSEAYARGRISALVDYLHRMQSK